jgi:hypothetical protein
MMKIVFLSGLWQLERLTNLRRVENTWKVS